jgi:hypothetical protein
VGRLEDIITRNRRPHGGFRATFEMAWRGLVILVILGLLIFTDWALTDGGGGPAARPPDPAERRLDDVPVLRQAPRPR